MANPNVALSLRVYRALSRAFPSEFKHAYGDELLQVTEEAIESIWRQHGTLGLARLLADLAIRVPAEHLAEFLQDARHGLRTLADSPGFTAVAILSLGLGICVATSAFSELYGVILRDLPSVPQPEQLVAIQSPTSYPTYQQYRERSDLFSDTFAYMAPVPFGISQNGQTERTWGHLVTPSYFSTLGVQPSLGRFFDEANPAPDTVVVSYRYWKNHLALDPAVIGKTLHINGRACTIIGVGPKEFLGASPLIFYADVWMPILRGTTSAIAPELDGGVLDRRDANIFLVVGRLKRGVTAARAEAELDTVARQFQLFYGEEDQRQKGRRVVLAPGGKLLALRSQDLPLVTAFPMVLVGLVLLIACSNVAHMLMARAGNRRREIAVRLALGASRARLVRQLLTESMLLAGGAGVFGFVLSLWLMHLASHVQMPFPMPVSYDLQPDWHSLLFTLLVTVLTGIAFGLAPALDATRADLTPALKGTSFFRFRRYRRLGLRNLLVLYQVSGSLTLLLLTGFLVLGFQRTSGIEIGFDTRNLYLLSLDPVRDGYTGERAADFFEKLLDRVKRLPSVTAATLTESVPMSSNGNPSVAFSSAGEAAAGPRLAGTAHRDVVGRDYFDTLGVPIVSGRGFRREDEAAASTAVIVTESLVRELWNGMDPVGRRIEIGSDAVAPGKGLDSTGTFDHRPASLVAGHRVFEVVGVAKDIKLALELDKPRPVIYFPLRASDYAQPSLLGVSLLVRSAPGGDVLSAVRREVSAMDANLTPFNVRSMPEQIDRLLYLFRLAGWIYGGVGLFGLILPSVGLAGVAAYSVSRRGREIGIRMALGATRGDVLRLVMQESLALVLAGTVLGLAGAWATARVLSSFLSSVARAANASTSDPVLLIGAPLLLGGLAVLACCVPARRSMLIDPAVALRQE
ncbi:MAG TPA: ABC transporter permease [Bryobacteraceae bacterium]|nr:ABC transporter permease [Bryobacteraceae bacterium]